MCELSRKRASRGAARARTTISQSHQQSNASSAASGGCHHYVTSLHNSCRKGPGVRVIGAIGNIAVVPGIKNCVWEATDASTEQLMDKFYDELDKGAGPDAALRAAKLSLLRGGFRNPFYWAPFQLYSGS
jgi:hypothetical protein